MSVYKSFVDIARDIGSDFPIDISALTMCDVKQKILGASDAELDRMLLDISCYI